MAQLFIDPRPFVNPPNSTLVGFERFLSLLAAFDWAGTPFVVDSGTSAETTHGALAVANHGPLSLSDRTTINARFRADREAGTGPAMYIVTADDRDGIEADEAVAGGLNEGWKPFWTQVGPERAVLQRMAAQAKKSLHSVECLLSTARVCAPEQWAYLFSRDCRSSCDALLVLKNNTTQCSSASKRAKTQGERESAARPFVNLDPGRTGAVRPALIGFDVVRDLIMKIETRFGHLVLLLYDELACAGKMRNAINAENEFHIALIWRPLAMLPVAFKLGCCSGSLPVSVPPSTQFVPNLTEVLLEIWLMASGIVDRIELC